MTLPTLPKISNYIASIDLVRQFHTTFKHPVAKQLTTADVRFRRLRVKLIADELAELCQALGVPLQVSVMTSGAPDNKKVGQFNGMFQTVKVGSEDQCHPDSKVDLVETADALADLDYVVQGSNLTFGIPAGLVMYEVHSSNMSKLGDDGNPIWDQDGKVVKGPNYREPDIKAVLNTFNPATEL